MRLHKDLGEGALENAGDNLLAYVRNTPRLTRDALLAIHGLMTVLGVAIPMLSQGLLQRRTVDAAVGQQQRFRCSSRHSRHD